MNCPKCPDQALKASAVPIEDRGIPGPRWATRDLHLDQCPACGGTWFDSDELNRYLDAKLSPLEVPNLPPGAADKLDGKSGRCPKCAASLRRQPARANPRVSLDACAACGGVWVDAAELKHAGGEGLPFADRMKSMFGDSK